MTAAKMDVASLTEIGKYFAILIFADSYLPRNTAKIGRPRKFPRIRYIAQHDDDGNNNKLKLHRKQNLKNGFYLSICIYKDHPRSLANAIITL